jgi:hypothetical protein
MLNSVAPFFIVEDLRATLSFYQSKLGFDALYQSGGDEKGDDYFAIVGRDRVTLMVKAITPLAWSRCSGCSIVRRARWGCFFVLYALTYGGFRIWLDTLHADPLRYYEGATYVTIGLVYWMIVWTLDRSRAETRPTGQRRSPQLA